MTSPIPSSPPVQAITAPARTFTDDAVPAASDPAAPGGGVDVKAKTPEPAEPATRLTVERDTQGVFVYTLTDSADGRVLAVIPRGVVAQKGGAALDVTA